MKGQKIMEVRVPLRKRGRPQGKGRTPLSLLERRARNALYERERRMENADAMAELAESIGCRPDEISNADLLATVITYLKKASVADPSQDLVSLKRINETLNKQIKNIEHRVAIDPELAGLTASDSEDENVLLHNNLYNETRKKIKRDSSSEPKAPCSRTRPFSYARYSRLKRDNQQREATRRRIIKTELDMPLDHTIKIEHTTPEVQTIKTEFNPEEFTIEEHSPLQVHTIKTEDNSIESNTKTERNCPEVHSVYSLPVGCSNETGQIVQPLRTIKTENNQLLEVGTATSPEFVDDDASSNRSQIYNPTYTGYAGRANKQAMPSQAVASLEVALSDSDDGVLNYLKQWSFEDFMLKYLR